MTLLGDLAELLPAEALAVGRAAKDLVVAGAGEVSKVLQPERIKPLLDFAVNGPIIPERFQFGSNLTQDGYMLLCAYSGYTTYEQFGVQPITVGLVGLQTVLHFNPSGYRLYEVGLNARRLVQYREAYRLVSSPVLHATLPHLVTNMATLMADGSELESRVGSAGMLGAVTAIGALSQGIYVAGCWTAAKLGTGRASLLQPYYHHYAVGFSGISFGLQALAGYLREADRGGLVEEEYPYTHGRYRCWLQLGVTHFLVPQASLAGHISGIAAGLLLVYAPQAWAALWRRLTGRQPPMRLRAGSLVRHRTRWWKDLLGHLVIGAGTVGVILMRRGQASGAAR